MSKLYGGIEAGGTKFVCVIGTGPDEILEKARFPTTIPQETIKRTLDFFQPYRERGELAGIGIGAFGPLDLNPHSPTYGYITTTPKPGWQLVDLSGEIRRGLDLPVSLDTDVNTAAIGEHFWIGENHAMDPFVYMTVGTGVGVGVLVGRHPLHGLMHPEAGHLFIPHSWVEDPFEGVCPYHGDCLEGLSSGTAMRKRWGRPAETLPPSHPAWDLEARYLAWGVCNLIYAYSPQRIVLGGGVLEHPGLLDRVRRQVLALLNGYIQSGSLLDRIDEYLISPRLGDRAGVLGAIALAIRHVEKALFASGSRLSAPLG